MPKKKAVAKKKAVKRVAPKAPVAEPPVAGQFKDVSWEWSEASGRFSSTLKDRMYNLSIDFGRPVLSAKCSLNGSGLGPKVEGSRILLRSNEGQFRAEVALGEGKVELPSLSSWVS